MIKVEDKSELKAIIRERYKESKETFTNTIYVGDLDVSNVEYMSGIFWGYEKLKGIEGLETWNVSNVKRMRGMFYDCNQLEQLDLSNWNVSNVEDMSGMFSRCESLKEIKGLETWDVSNVEYMEGMFHRSNQLEQLDLSNWNVSKVEDDINEIFWGCEELQEDYEEEDYDM